MRRYLSVIVLAAFCTGCAGPQRILDATVLQSLQTIAVIPLEAPAPRDPVRGGGEGCAGGKLGLVLLPVVIPAAILTSVHEANRAAAIPEGALTLEREPQSDSRRLTVALARVAAETLQERGARTAYLVDSYLRLPMADTATSRADVQFEERTRLQRWYAEKVARVGYSGMSPEGMDAILEVGLSDYGCPNDEANCAVQVRLVNPATNEVLGRATHQTRLRKLFWWWEKRPTPEQLANLAKDKRREAIMECLKALGLIRSPL
jgi:hypothetical protein